MPNSVGGNGAKRKLAEGKLVLCMGVIGVREDFEFQTWLTELGMRYLTGGSDLDYILSGPCRSEAVARGAASVESRIQHFSTSGMR